MVLAILILLALPFYNISRIKSMQFKPLNKLFFWFFFSDCILLGWIGSNPAEDPYILIGQGCTIFYFFYLIVFLPFISLIENKLILSK
jgi:quinol-cytochrome oxidoreductase complex cytochrome b subunit